MLPTMRRFSFGVWESDSVSSSPWGIKVRHMPIFLPSVLDFGEVLVSVATTLDVELHNHGGTYIDFETAYTNVPEFYVFSVGPTTLNPEDEITIYVTFQPESIGEFFDTLVVELEYGDDLTVPLTGECVASGVNDVNLPSEYEFSIFPNPFNNQLQISFDQQNPAERISIYDIAGNIVSDVNNKSGSNRTCYTWNPADLAGGIYFVTIQTRNTTMTRKVVYLK